jgi:hypothetical protein
MNDNPQEQLKTVKEIPVESDMVSKIAEASELADNPEIVKEVTKYGKTPVVYGPTKAMLKRPQDPGLLTLIENSITIQEVKNLLIKGVTDYKNAHPKTIRKWEAAANKRIAELA